jgi:hypothetical protein
MGRGMAAAWDITPVTATIKYPTTFHNLTCARDASLAHIGRASQTSKFLL